jgi:PAS domain S-box-containing protein
MRDRPTSGIARYGIAIAAVAAAILIRYLLTPWLGATFPLATMFTAVAFVVWRQGWGPALFTAIGGWAASNVAFRNGMGFFGGITVNELIGFLVYMLGTGPIIILGEKMRAAHRELEARHTELSTTNLVLEHKIEAQSLLAAIVASSDDAIISKTLDGVLTSWNKGAERLFGWTAAEAVGQSIHLIVPPEFHEQEREILGDDLAGLRPPRAHHRRLEDGARHHRPQGVGGPAGAQRGSAAAARRHSRCDPRPRGPGDRDA